MDFLNRLPHMLQDYTVGRLRRLEAEHVARKLAMRTKAEVLEYQHDTWEKLRLIFGPEPKRTPLKPRITGGFERTAYRVENIIFESRPGFPVTGNLYIPKDRDLPAPCVLGVCGHSMNGKAYEAYQNFAQGLATKGYVVFIFDPLGQGERMQYPDGKGGSRYGGSVLDHIQAGNQQRLVGEWLGAWRAWDGVRALDYLLSREEADPTHVGLTGCSGGGTLTTWLLACDRRFTMAAPSCYVTTWRRNLENELPADSEQNPPLALALGLDVDDLLAMHAPKPLLLLTEELDFFDIRGAEEIYARLRHVYRLLGKPYNIGIYTGPLGHGYSQGQREAMYGWFHRATGKAAETNKEPRLVAEADALLWATKSGQVAELNPPNVATFTAEASRKLAARRKPLEGEALCKALRQLLNLSPRTGVPDYRILRPTGAIAEGLWPTAYAVETEPGIQTVLTLVGPGYLGARIPPGRQATVYVPHLSADLDLREEPFARELMAGKRRLFAVDLRGMGESRPNTCGGVDNWLNAYGSDFFYAYWLEMLGDNMVGRRVHDLLGVLDVLADRGYDDIHLAGRGWGSIPALFAAVLDDRVTQLALKNAPLAFSAIAEDEDYRWPLSGIVPGLLRKLDLPDCYRALGGRVRIIEPWNSRSEPMPAAEARSAVRALGLPLSLLRT